MMILGHELDGGAVVKINLPRLVETRLLVQANSGGGKSHTLREMLEATHGHVQQIIIDPEGEFSTLREQFDYVYAAPRGGDCLATPQTAELLARRVMELGCSIIIDIYELKAHERLLFVKRFLDALINLPKNLWHECIVVLDEADKFAPESGKGQADSRQAVIDLASRGRKRGLCAWIAVTRSAKLSKDVTAELNNRIMGRATIKEDRKRNAEELGIIGRAEVDRFSRLKPGEFFVQGPALSDELSLVKVAAVQTSHPKVGKKFKATPAPSARVKKILAELADLPKEAQEEARTVEELRLQVVDLKRQLRAAPKEKIIERGRAPKVVMKAPVDRAAAREQMAAINRFMAAYGRFVESMPKVGEVGAVGVWISKLMDAPDPRSMVTIPMTTPVARIVEQAKRVVTKLTTPTNGHAAGDTSIGKGEKITLAAIAQYGPDGIQPEQLSVLTGYRRSSRDAYLARLRKAGYITDGRPIVATDEGIAALGSNYEPLPTGTKLREYWMQRLPEGEKKCLGILIEAYPNEVRSEEIDERTGYRRSSRDAYLSRLSSRKLITKPSRGAAKAATTLFD